MDTFLLLAYITGGLLVAYSLFLYIFPSRRLNLLLKAGADVISCINLLFVYLATGNVLVIAGIATNMIACFREVLFSFRGDWKVLDCIAWPIGFSVIFALSLIFTYESPVSIFPVVGSIVSTISVYFINKKLLKSGMMIACALYVVYNLCLVSSSGVLIIFSLLCAIAGFISATIGLFIVLFKKPEEISD